MTDFTTLTVYLGSSGRARPVFRDSALKLGRMIGQKNKKLVYGGMDAGLMGLVANAALESGAHVTGIIPKTLKDSERIHPFLSETILVNSLWERKRRMFKKADAIIGLPGGFGTLDECLEVLYWGNLGLHGKPLALVNIEGYWDTLIRYIRTLPDFDARFLIVADTLENLFPALDAHSFQGDIKVGMDEYPHFEGEILNDSHDPLIFEHATIAQSYYLITALGLKQLDKHQRPIGLLNTGGQFDDLMRWFETAEKETFITPKCLSLMDMDSDKDALLHKLKAQKEVHIDLHAEKWGKGETSTHLNIHEE